MSAQGHAAGPPTHTREAEVRLGEVLADRYRVTRLIGRGGMGVVVEAERLDLGELVAVKILHTRHLDNAEAVARFHHEARAAARVRGEHSIRLYDEGTTSAGTPFLVMELLRGRDLASVVEQGPLSVQDAALYVLQACEGMAEVHAHGIVHRDLKPANLFLAQRADGSPLVKVLDFGIAKGVVAAEGLAPALTQTLVSMGTPLYMSPEQAQGLKDIDARTDIWSIGAVLYEALTGRSPFQDADNLGKLILAICSKRPPRPKDLADIPPELDELVMRCLAIEREERFASADDLLAALLDMVPEGTRVGRGEVWAANLVQTLRTSRPGGLRPSRPSGLEPSRPSGSRASRPSDLKVVPAGSDLDIDTTRAVEEAGVASTLYATSQTSAPAGRKKTPWAVFAAAGGVGVAAAAAAAIWAGGEGERPVATPSQTVASAVVTSAPARDRVTVAIDVVPPDATVIVGGAEQPLRSGVLELEGEIGQEIVVTVKKGERSRKEIVTVTESGPRPREVLLEPPQPAVGATERARAEAAPATPTSTAQRPTGGAPGVAGGKKTPPTAIPVHAPEFE